MTEEKRGRKSKAELEAVPDAATVAELPRPPDPPATLDVEGKRRWRDIVDENSANRFRDSDLKMLEQLVRTEQLVDEMDRNIRDHGQVIGDPRRNAFPVENPAVRIRDRGVRTMLSLQVKLRLCPSTRMRAEEASLRRTKKTKRPWK